jgi:hypothetical protein
MSTWRSNQLSYDCRRQRLALIVLAKNCQSDGAGVLIASDWRVAGVGLPSSLQLLKWVKYLRKNVIHIGCCPGAVGRIYGLQEL